METMRHRAAASPANRHSHYSGDSVVEMAQEILLNTFANIL